MKFFRWTLLLLLFLFLGVISAAFLYLQSSRPVYHGEMHLKGIKDVVKVYFDNHGIPQRVLLEGAPLKQAHAPLPSAARPCHLVGLVPELTRGQHAVLGLHRLQPSRDLPLGLRVPRGVPLGPVPLLLHAIPHRSNQASYDEHRRAQCDEQTRMTATEEQRATTNEERQATSDDERGATRDD